MRKRRKRRKRRRMSRMSRRRRNSRNRIRRRRSGEGGDGGGDSTSAEGEFFRASMSSSSAEGSLLAASGFERQFLLILVFVLTSWKSFQGARRVEGPPVHQRPGEFDLSLCVHVGVGLPPSVSYFTCSSEEAIPPILGSCRAAFSCTSAHSSLVVQGW